MESIFRFCQRHLKVLLIVVIAAVMLYTFIRHNLVDDAFISFRYAENLVEEHGLVWNPGEKVEGYSNFLWVILVAAGLKIGCQPESFTFFLSIPIFLVCLILTYRLASRLLNSRTWGIFITAWIGFNPSVSAFTTSGMETPFQLMLFLAVADMLIICMLEGWNKSRTITLSFLVTLAILLRPDSILLAALVGLVFWQTNRPLKLWNVFYIVLPLAHILIPYLMWKVGFYGSIFPNSFNAKVRDLAGIGYGMRYIYLFLICHLLVPFVIVTLWRGVRLFRRDRKVGYLGLFSLIWMIYTISVGGDFMLFRFLVPVLPFMMIAVSSVLKDSFLNRKTLFALVLALSLGNLNAYFALGNVINGYGLENIRSLRDHLNSPSQNWIGIGRKLGEMFGGTDVLISAGAAGAIPYYSKLNSVDFCGLCDAEIPQKGDPFSIVPGHRVVATLEYLVDRKVNLVIEPNNFMVNNDMLKFGLRAAKWRDLRRHYINIDKPVHGRPIEEAVLIAIPVGENYSLIAWYLTPHPAVDRAIEEYSLDRVRVMRP